MGNQSIIEHRANYYYVEFREDYLQICLACKYTKPVKEGRKKSKASAYCKSLILAIMEGWTNHKRGHGKDLSVSMSYAQWGEAMYGMFGRNVILDSLDELVGEGLLSREAHKVYGKDTYKYLFNYAEVNHRLKTLPDRDPHASLPQTNAFTNKPVPDNQFTSKPDPSQSKPDAFTNKPVTHLQVNPTHLQVNGYPFTKGPFIESNIESSQNQNIETKEGRNSPSDPDPFDRGEEEVSFPPSSQDSSSEEVTLPPSSVGVSQEGVTSRIATTSRLYEVPLLDALTEEASALWMHWCVARKIKPESIDENAYNGILELAQLGCKPHQVLPLFDATNGHLKALSDDKGTVFTPAYLRNVIQYYPTWASQQSYLERKRARNQYIPGTGHVRNATQERLERERNGEIVATPVYERLPEIRPRATKRQAGNVSQEDFAVQLAKLREQRVPVENTITNPCPK